jgi:shikimate dehydrogenase
VVLRYAVMGNPIAHSLSPNIHQLFAKQTGIALTYEKILIDLPQFERQVDVFFEQGGQGLNITLPCKERAFAMSAFPSAHALQAKAANTLWMHDGKLYADNTDGVGLVRDLSRYVDLSGKRLLLLGAGGAARGVLASLLAVKPSQVMVSNRTFEKLLVLQSDFPLVSICPFDALGQSTYDVVINATSAATVVLPAELTVNKPFCYDLAYDIQNPTPFVAWAKKFNCSAVDGLGMLVEQAAEAFFLWHGVRPDVSGFFR